MLRAKEDIKLDGPEGEIIEKGSLWYQPLVGHLMHGTAFKLGYINDSGPSIGGLANEDFRSKFENVGPEDLGYKNGEEGYYTVAFYSYTPALGYGGIRVWGLSADHVREIVEEKFSEAYFDLRIASVFKEPKDVPIGELYATYDECPVCHGRMGKDPVELPTDDFKTIKTCAHCGYKADDVFLAKRGENVKSIDVNLKTDEEGTLVEDLFNREGFYGSARLHDGNLLTSIELVVNILAMQYEPAVLQSLLENEQGFDIVKDTFEKVLKEKEEKDVTPRSISDFSEWLDKQKAMDESTEGD